MSVSILKKRANSRKLHFVTFGSVSWEKTKFRLADQAKHTGWFETVNCFDDKTAALRKYKKSFNGYMAGFGWWKPAIVLELFKNIPENDIVLYLDAGFNIFKEREKKLVRYLDYVVEHNVLAFSGKGKNNILEKQYTKRDLLLHLNCDSESFYSNQFAGGQFLVVNNEYGRSFMHNFLKVYDNINLANDTPSTVSEHPEFITHRHCQSILSLLYKLSGLEGLRDESDTWLDDGGPIGPFSADRIADYQMNYLNWTDNTYSIEEIRKLVYKKRLELHKDETYRLK